MYNNAEFSFFSILINNINIIENFINELLDYNETLMMATLNAHKIVRFTLLTTDKYFQKTS